MAGRFSLTASPQEVAEYFGLAAIDGFPPRPLILPTQPIMVVLAGREGRVETYQEGREATLVRWGLIPGWFRGEEQLPALFNARAETAHENAAFRGALRHRRCLVPASAFFRRIGGRDEAGALRRFCVADEPVFGFAGVMESYMAPDGSEIDTAAILTGPTHPDDCALVDRFPVIVARRDFGRWLDCRSYEPGGVSDLLAAPRAEDFTVEAVA